MAEPLAGTLSVRVSWENALELLTGIVHQARADLALVPGHMEGIETEDAAVRIRQDAREFLVSVQSAYIEIRDAAGAVMDVIYRRRLAGPIVNEVEGVCGEKSCSRCGARKEAIEFYMVRRRGYATRRDSWCSECRRATKRVIRPQLPQ